MSKLTGPLLALAGLYPLVATLCFLWGHLHFGALIIKPDESIYTQTSLEMEQHKSYLIPILEGSPSFIKPPLVYWLNIISFHVFGESVWSARLPIWILGLLSTLLISKIGKELFDKKKGWIAGALLFSNIIFFTYSQANMMDVPLTFFVLFTLYGFIRAHRTNQLWFLCSGASLGLTFLIKGPVGTLLALAPVLLASSFLVQRPESLKYKKCHSEGAKRPKNLSLDPSASLTFGLRMTYTQNFQDSALARQPLWAALGLALLISVSWPLLLAGRGYGHAWLSEFILNENFGKFSGPIMPFKILLIGLLGGLIPWTFLFLESFWKGILEIRMSREKTFLILWIAFVFVIFLLPARKLPHYAMPAIPACCLLIAATENFSSHSLWATRILLGALGIAWILGARLTHSFPVAFFLILGGVAGIAAGLVLQKRDKLMTSALVFGVMLFTFPIVAPGLEYPGQTKIAGELSGRNPVAAFCPSDLDLRGFEIAPTFLTVTDLPQALSFLRAGGTLIVEEHDAGMLGAIPVSVQRRWNVWRRGIGLGDVKHALLIGDLSSLQEEMRAERSEGSR